MAIFNSSVKLPEGNSFQTLFFSGLRSHVHPCVAQKNSSPRMPYGNALYVYIYHITPPIYGDLGDGLLLFYPRFTHPWTSSTKTF